MTPVALTLEQFNVLFPAVHDADAEKYRVALNSSALAYGIHTPQRYSAYAAQIGHESLDLTVREENLYYSGERLIAMWPKRFKDLAEAKFYAEAGPEAIANRVYSNRMGNGPEASGDGYRYRARGPIGQTGLDNYRAAEKAMLIPFVSNPELLAEIGIGCMNAGWFWNTHDCNRLADHDSFDAISDIINIGHFTEKIGDANGYADRFKRWMKARKTFGLSTDGLL